MESSGRRSGFSMRTLAPRKAMQSLEMTAVRLVSGSFLVALWAVVGWAILHRGRIRQMVLQNDAMPRPTPKRNFLLLLGVSVTALSVLLLYLMKG
jgi:hypothetical protein